MRSTATPIFCSCGARLNGGPTRFTCSEGHGLSAADLHREIDVITDQKVAAAVRRAGGCVIALTDVTGRQVDQYFLLRQIQQQATSTQTATTTDDNAGR
jgi:hypothetical protein